MQNFTEKLASLHSMIISNNNVAYLKFQFWHRSYCLWLISRVNQWKNGELRVARILVADWCENWYSIVCWHWTVSSI